MPNHLADETSPYLRQHAENPVDWYPWGPRALERARHEDKPILLSIGYAACHWCHVMAHESFEDPETARVMNEHFVNIKVDREERPDVDSIYMQAVQSMTGHGGWPMTMFLTPRGEPFYAGTYFPPTDRPGMPAFRRILRVGRRRLSLQARPRRADGGRDARHLRGRQCPADGVRCRWTDTLDRAYRALATRYDAVAWGVSTARRRFPPTMTLEFLLIYARELRRTPRGAWRPRRSAHMARGGIFDQIGGGFHRYAVDDAWLVPHFEKMLYDNALLVRFGVHLWQSSADAEVRRVTEATLDWVRREMTDADGGFFASLDADSEGEEGRFYVWDERGARRHPRPDSALFKAYYGVTPGGNFEGRISCMCPDDPAVVAQRTGSLASVVAARLTRAREPCRPPARAGRGPVAMKEARRLERAHAARRRLAACAFERAGRCHAGRGERRFLARALVRPEAGVMRARHNGVTEIPGYPRRPRGRRARLPRHLRVDLRPRLARSRARDRRYHRDVVLGRRRRRASSTRLATPTPSLPGPATSPTTPSRRARPWPSICSSRLAELFDDARYARSGDAGAERAGGADGAISVGLWPYADVRRHGAFRRGHGRLLRRARIRAFRALSHVANRHLRAIARHGRGPPGEMPDIRRCLAARRRRPAAARRTCVTTMSVKRPIMRPRWPSSERLALAWAIVPDDLSNW